MLSVIEFSQIICQQSYWLTRFSHASENAVVINKNNYISYESALLRSQLDTLARRRQIRCLDFSIKSIKHPQNKHLFPLNKTSSYNLRNSDSFKVNHANNIFYQNSSIPCCQRLLNEHFREKEKEEKGRRWGWGGGTMWIIT